MHDHLNEFLDVPLRLTDLYYPDEMWLRWKTAEGRPTKAHLLDRRAGSHDGTDALYVCGVRQIGGVKITDSSFMLGGRYLPITSFLGEEVKPKPGLRLDDPDLCRACARAGDAAHEEYARAMFRQSFRQCACPSIDFATAIKNVTS